MIISVGMLGGAVLGLTPTTSLQSIAAFPAEWRRPAVREWFPVCSGAGHHRPRAATQSGGFPYGCPPRCKRYSRPASVCWPEADRTEPAAARIVAAAHCLSSVPARPPRPCLARLSAMHARRIAHPQIPPLSHHRGLLE